VDVGAILPVEAQERVDHLLRLLRRRGIVEVDERLAVESLRQRGKIRADPRRIETAAGLSLHRFAGSHHFTSAS